MQLKENFQELYVASDGILLRHYELTYFSPFLRHRKVFFRSLPRVYCFFFFLNLFLKRQRFLIFLQEKIGIQTHKKREMKPFRLDIDNDS